MEKETRDKITEQFITLRNYGYDMFDIWCIHDKAKEQGFLELLRCPMDVYLQLAIQYNDFDGFGDDFVDQQSDNQIGSV